MKLRGWIKNLIIGIFFISTGNLYAANGDLIVNGNLGVGTATPAGKAEVNGNMIVDGNLGVGTTAPTGKAEINGTAVIDGDTTMKGNATINGNVGVGTTAPTQKLEVNGNVKATGVCIGGGCTSTLHVSGGLYGFCTYCMFGNGNILIKTDAHSPAYCTVGNSGGICTCPAGYTITSISNSDGSVQWSTCYKN